MSATPRRPIKSASAALFEPTPEFLKTLAQRIKGLEAQGELPTGALAQAFDGFVLYLAWARANPRSRPPTKPAKTGAGKMLLSEEYQAVCQAVEVFYKRMDADADAENLDWAPWTFELKRALAEDFRGSLSGQALPTPPERPLGSSLAVLDALNGKKSSRRLYNESRAAEYQTRMVQALRKNPRQLNDWFLEVVCDALWSKTPPESLAHHRTAKGFALRFLARKYRRKPETVRKYLREGRVLSARPF